MWCITELINATCGLLLFLLCYTYSSGIPNHLVDPQLGSGTACSYVICFVYNNKKNITNLVKRGQSLIFAIWIGKCCVIGYQIRINLTFPSFNIVIYFHCCILSIQTSLRKKKKVEICHMPEVWHTTPCIPTMTRLPCQHLHKLCPRHAFWNDAWDGSDTCTK